MPPTAKEVRRALIRAGFVEVSQRGSHLRLERVSNAGIQRVVIPMHVGDLKTGTLHAILSAAGMSEDDLRRLLKG